MLASGDVGVLPIHSATEGVQGHRSKSNRTRSSNLLHTSEPTRSDRSSKASSKSLGIATSPTNIPRAVTRHRTNSAPGVPMNKPQTSPDLANGLHSYNYRDSVTSIKDDPFFRNYQTPQSISLARELRSASYSSNGLDDDSLEDPAIWTNHKSSLPPAIGAASSQSSMENINIAVVGAAGVGKSTLIQRALGLRTLPTAVASSLRMSVDDIVYTVSLVELDLESFDFNPDRPVQWPKQINGQIVPRMDGALILYDVMNRESITDLPQTLNALVYSGLPTILVACKCDNPVNTRQIDTVSIEAACVAEVETLKTAANVPESARLCLGAMLRAIMANRGASEPAPKISRPSTVSSMNVDSRGNGHDEPPSGESKQGRASSEFSMLKGFPSPPFTSSRTPNTSSVSTLTRQNHSAKTNLHQYPIPGANTAPPLSLHPAFRGETLQETSDSETESNVPLEPVVMGGLDTGKGVNSFLDMEESDADSTHRYSDDVPILQRNDDSFVDRPAKVAGFTFDELVDRLLSQHMSRTDSNFSDIFLCLYRKFAAPGELFSAVLGRLEQVAKDSSLHYLTRTGTQLRVITVIAKWVSSYPGDFASTQTRDRLSNFIEQLSAEPAFAAAAQEMRTELQLHVTEDDDTGWARTDADVEVVPNSTANFLVTPSVRSTFKPSNEFTKGASSTRGGEDPLENRDRRPSEVASVSSTDAHSISESNPPLFHSVEDYESEARRLVPGSTLPLTKFRYRICMDTSDDDFADEITRIDWVMFSSIRVRDLVRHVSLPLEQKEKCKSLANVNRMIDHFNHVAKWVSNMILIRDKAKHRAQMLEKFMRIALKLRQLNNYNGLAAIIAGINGSAVHRLAHTRALVPAECQKRFMRLELLMSTQKSHFAYRLAWENSSLPRIPFIPLHRRDLVSAEEGSRTFVGPAGDRINWKKFEVLAEVILPIMRSQGTPYSNLERHEIAQELILDCRMPTDEEEIYQRSLQLESTSSSTFEVSKKKFPWFQK